MQIKSHDRDPKALYGERLISVEGAAGLILPEDQLALPIAGGQPAALLRALGRRDDWKSLQLLGGLFLEPYEVLTRPGVKLLSGFFGLVERMLRERGFPVDYLVSDFRGQARALARAAPRVVAESVSPMDAEGYFTFGVHAGATYTDFVRAGSDPDRILIVEANPHMPAIGGIPELGANRIHVSQVDVVIESEIPLFSLPDIPPTAEERAIASLVVERVDQGATLQFGIGGVPNEIARALAGGEKGSFGIHTEMIPDGVMHLHQAGKIVNQKGLHDGLSVATFALGSSALYKWMDGNPLLGMLPVENTNEPATIRANRNMTSVNSALSIDLQGQVVAESLDGRQYSGTGGHTDFVNGARECRNGKSFLALTSTVEADGRRASRIVARHPEGAIVTTPRQYIQLLVTEHGAVDLGDLSDAERIMAIASVADPEFRPGLEADALGLISALRAQR